MADDYHIDLKKISISKFRKILETAELVPSRRILQEKTAEKFELLQKLGAQSMYDVALLLKTPKERAETAKKTGISEDYLTILKREIGSYLPKPVAFAKFPGLCDSLLAKLERAGIKNTKQLYAKGKTKRDRKTLCKRIGIDEEQMMELVKLTDLSRIKWIGPVFSRIFYASGFDTAEKIAAAEATSLFGRLVDINRKHNFVRANFTENDAGLVIEAARIVPKSIEY